MKRQTCGHSFEENEVEGSICTLELLQDRNLEFEDLLLAIHSLHLNRDHFVRDDVLCLVYLTFGVTKEGPLVTECSLSYLFDDLPPPFDDVGAIKHGRRIQRDNRFKLRFTFKFFTGQYYSKERI